MVTQAEINSSFLTADFKVAEPRATSISKSMSFWLRHGYVKKGMDKVHGPMITVGDIPGFLDINLVMKLVDMERSRHWQPVSVREILFVIGHSENIRYMFYIDGSDPRDDHTKGRGLVRAISGHSAITNRRGEVIIRPQDLYPPSQKLRKDQTPMVPG